MFSFIFCVLFLIAGFLFYSKVVERNIEPTDSVTPAVANNDGVDYVPMPLWKLFLIQLLNIAGTGPIFGALSGALFGPIVYLWIILGCVFAGATHDFMLGMMSMRNNGGSASEIIGLFMGKGMKNVMRVFSVILLIMCGVVFTTGPAGLLDLLTKGAISNTIWIWVILAYYFIATFLPIDKIIGKIYPIFGICLIIMAVGVGGSLLVSGQFEMPEIWNNFTNLHPQEIPVWPFMFITVACGAISGFHATQSPLMARCCTSEKQGRKVFYGAMIAEGIIALVWAAAGVSCYDSTQALLEAGGGCSAVVYEVCTSTLGKVGSILAIIGVIACPITSGDTAFRSARLTIADWFNIKQDNNKKRLLLTIPLLAIGAIICHIDYSIVWRYFSWSNQTLAMIVLWAASIYLRSRGKNHLITTIPAIFMSAVSITYFFAAPECFGHIWSLLNVSDSVYYPIAVGLGIIGALLFLFLFIKSKFRTAQPEI